MNPQDFQPPAPISNDPLANADPDAQLVCEIRRHPIGIVGLYIGVGLLLTLLAIVLFAVVPGVLANYDRSRIISINTLVFAGAALVAVVFVLVGHVVYWGNRWIVTSESITQIVRTGLFSKQTSQLSLANLEDLTAEQHGLFAHLFRYGAISAETAANNDKFFFNYCPKPTYYAQQILTARDYFEESRQPDKQNAPPAPPTETGYHVPG